MIKTCEKLLIDLETVIQYFIKSKTIDKQIVNKIRNELRNTIKQIMINVKSMNTNDLTLPEIRSA